MKIKKEYMKKVRLIALEERAKKSGVKRVGNVKLKKLKKLKLKKFKKLKLKKFKRLNLKKAERIL